MMWMLLVLSTTVVTDTDTATRRLPAGEHVDNGCGPGDEPSCASALAIAVGARDRATGIRTARADGHRRGGSTSLSALVVRCERGDLAACTTGLGAMAPGQIDALVVRLLRQTVEHCLQRRMPCDVSAPFVDDPRVAVGFYDRLAMMRTTEVPFRVPVDEAAETRLRVRSVGVLLPPDPRADAEDHAQLAERLRALTATREQVDACLGGGKDTCTVVTQVCTAWGVAEPAACAALLATDGDGTTAPLSARDLKKRAQQEQALACAHAGFAADDARRTDPRCSRP